ncbi:MAG: cobalamin biosynthesis protein CobD [Alphaproteobacteria bacterium]|jgi:adenosylcobinamide-phosphate synthase|nr:cobalamin biosynthesis protein CobD [Alphaproteobacteria bacterium]MBT4082178.1 cobalamin biosynthesis protein CobD [Alphaproteobacteria bacterium]MBT4545031.1 cobalamin biosynthesis protein CobD [Alphaproteobacteria bacterium]MBT7745814.1 cobalamin biosynthesis protein CobD [Alphaproteobacteria bacterium]
MSVSLILALALGLDALAGEPKWIYQKLPHPVVLMSGFLMTGERWLNRTDWQPDARRMGGIVVIVAAILVMTLIGLGIELALSQLEAGALILVVIVAILMAARSLYDHVEEVRVALEKTSDLDPARTAVGKIIGRETDQLDEAAISRAAIESLAENFSDGVTAPAFWFLVAGLPGLLVYKMVNTADSMIGHRNDRYLYFGWAAARLDDVMNLVPARLTAILFAGAAIVPGRGRQALSTAWQQARLHASPNAGWPEAAMAGALDVRLGGPRTYPDNLVVDGAWFGTGGDTNNQSLSRAIRITVSAWLIMVLALTGWSFA